MLNCKKYLVFTFLLSNFILLHANEYEGILFAEKKVTLSLLSTGVVREVLVKAGDAVTTGKILVQLDDKKDSLQLVLAERQMRKGNIEGNNEVENQISLEMKKISLEEKRLKAPFSGMITQVMLRPFEYYSTGTKAIEIADLRKLFTEIYVPKSELDAIKINAVKVQVHLDKVSKEGRLDSYNPLSQPGMGLFLVRIAFDNPSDWSPGTNVKVTTISNKK